MGIAFTIGIREGVEAAVVVLLVAARLRAVHPAGLPAFRRRCVLAVLAAVAGGAALHAGAASLPTATVAAVEVVVAAVAVVMLSLVARWSLQPPRAAALAGPTPHAHQVATLTSIAVLAIGREGLEASWFLAATEHGPAVGAVLGLTGGALVAVLVVLAARVLLLDRRGPAAVAAASSLALTALAGGMVVVAVQALGANGWLPLGANPALHVSWLAARELGGLRSLLEVVGIQPAYTGAAVVAWAAYLVFGVSVWARSSRRVDLRGQA